MLHGVCKKTIRGVQESYGTTCMSNKRTLSTITSPSDIASNFENVVQSRRFCKTFDKEKTIDPALLQKILRLSQTAPSSFNLQPYKIILVQEHSVREALADAMLGGNPQRVRDAPLTVVYLSHKGQSLTSTTASVTL